MTDNQRLLWSVILALALIVAAWLVLPPDADAAPCFDSIEAARVGYSGHVSWTGHPRRYYRGHPSEHVRCDEPTERKVMRSAAARSVSPPDSRPRPVEPPAGAEPPVSRYTAPSIAWLRSWDTPTPVLWLEPPRARAPLPSTTGAAPRRIERVTAAAQPALTKAELSDLWFIAILGLLFAFAHPIARAFTSRSE